jgi:hypothetical protein
MIQDDACISAVARATSMSFASRMPRLHRRARRLLFMASTEGLGSASIWTEALPEF